MTTRKRLDQLAAEHDALDRDILNPDTSDEQKQMAAELQGLIIAARAVEEKLGHALEMYARRRRRKWTVVTEPVGTRTV